jgi:hypothetical protein
MPRNPFVKPETIRYDLAEGDWIDVKKFLTAAEEARLSGAGVPGFTQGEPGKQTFELDFVALKFARMLCYVEAWSFVDAKGNQTKPTRDYIETLQPDVFDEIDAVLDKHRKAMEEERKRPTSAPVGATS